MKNLFKLLGIAVLVTVIGFSFVSCDDGGGGGSGGYSGTVIVRNASFAPQIDSVIYADVSDANNANNVLQSANIGINNSRSFSIPAGRSVRVWVIDGLGSPFYTAPFTLSGGETRRYRFTGSSIVRE